ncbi:hypothetical protein [Helicobacter felistomachi]|uniref:hypothetical protein n=1 Tax=Helicobacter felistomachi TaxID=3040201 RepID=UPI002573D40B|nr:hypothetical protein [Helicobacter sp. NHP21005]
MLPAVLVVGLGAFFYLHHSTGDTQTINQEDTAKVGKPSPSPNNSAKDQTKDQATNANGGDQAQESQTSPDSALKDNPKDPTQAKTTLDATPKPTESKAPQSALKPPRPPRPQKQPKPQPHPRRLKNRSIPKLSLPPPRATFGWKPSI